MAGTKRVFVEGTLTFAFEVDATQYDDWAFYRNQVNALAGGAKAVDFLAMQPVFSREPSLQNYRKKLRSR